MEHCCQVMKTIIEDGNSPIIYNPKIREYSLPNEPCYCGKRESSSISVRNLINFCPWCGNRLPKSLRNVWIRELKKNFLITNLWDDEQLQKLPKEYLTDEWWKKNKF